MHPRATSGITLIEVIVGLVIILILTAILIPLPGGNMVRGQGTQTLSNQKQLYLATQQMALDGVTTTNTNLGWPGDTGGTFAHWTTRLLPDYLSTNDLCKLLSAPGRIVPPGHMPTASESAQLLYAVTEKSSGEVVFLTTANFSNTPTGGTPLDPKAIPYGNKEFVVFRKAGDGAILLPRQVGQTNIIGLYAPLCP